MRPLVLKVIRVLLVHKEMQVLKVTLVLKVLKDIRVLLQLVQMEL